MAIDNGWAIIICDLEMLILESVIEKKMPLTITVDGCLEAYILHDNYSRFLDFSAQLKREKKAFGYEISTVDAENKPTIINFNGIEFEGQFIMGLFQNFFEFYEGLIGIEDARIELLRGMMKNYYIESSNYNHLTELNNQMLNIQRELTKKNSEIQTVNDMKDRIFSVIGHDLRAPLASIISYMNLMSQDQISYETLLKNDLFELLKLSAGNSMVLLENLLEWSRCQIGEITFSPVNVNLAHLMREVTAQFKTVAVMKKITFFEAYLGEAIVFADQRMIGTVLRNLISNAVKFSDQGGHIYVEIYAEDGVVKLTVRDEGVGMSEDRIGELLKPNLNSVILGTLGENGVGFGLSLCKRFMDDNKGTISISSAIGKGTTVTITLPQITMKEK